MNEAKHLHDLKMLHQIAAEEIGNILTAPTQLDRDKHEKTYQIAMKGIIKTIKQASEKENYHQTSYSDCQNVVA